MKAFAIATLLAAGVSGVQAQAFIDNARVRSAEPQYENVSVPRQVCTNEWIREGRYDAGPQQYGGAVVGGVAGALLGNQVGRGHGREAATAVGAVIGALTGDRIANGDRWDRREEAREVQRCHTVNDVQARVTGYRVNYEYRGQQYATVMRENPGQFVQVRVTVDPVERY
ncbi:MAG: 17 kDa surface antigen [Ramlibacter sp.]|jgi:uncharacterized protein YcfJ|nr:17 kDa surface antigen [Ramlibacter sp.]